MMNCLTLLLLYRFPTANLVPGSGMESTLGHTLAHCLCLGAGCV